MNEKQQFEDEVWEFVKKEKMVTTRDLMEEFGISRRRARDILIKFQEMRRVTLMGNSVWVVK